jgi:heme exporter protein D
MTLLSDNLLYIVVLSNFCSNAFGISLLPLVVLVFNLVCQLKNSVSKVWLLLFL